MPLSDDDIRYGFRFLLGREVESDAIIHHFKEHIADFEALREALIASEEFRFIQAARAGSADCFRRRRR